MQLKVTKKALIEAIKETSGNLTEVATRCGVARKTVHERINRDPELAQVVQDARDSLVDLAESEIRKLIEQGNIAAIIFTLKTWGKHRGWVERVELAPPTPDQPLKAYIGVSPDDWEKDAEATN